MSTAVVTIVAGRHEHLHHQQSGLAGGDQLPDHYVVVAMGDEQALRLSESGPLADTTTAVHAILVDTVLVDAAERLPLASARNAGAAAALSAGADTVVFLDVDCIPSRSLLARYRRAVAAEVRPTLHCGVVRYLGPEASAARPPLLVGDPHPARPVPGPGDSQRSQDWQLFWSLSFAVSARTWKELGGFCEDYVGYGAEDTDLGYAAHLAGIDLRWIGGADAFHQFHPTESPPVRHLADIVRNATVFHRRWGFWPMEGWLRGFRTAGLVEYDERDDRWYLLEQLDHAG